MEKNNVIEFDRPADFYYEAAMRYLDDVDFLRALPLLRRALEKEPENVDFLLTYSEVLTEMGKFDESNSVLLDMLKDGNVHPECFFGLGCNFIGVNDFEKAQQSFERYLDADTEGEFSEEALDFLQFIEEFADSGNICKVGEKENYELAGAGKKKLDMGEYKGAISILQQVEDPSLLFAKNNLALSYYCDGQADKAIEISKEVLARDGNNIHALCNLAMFYAHKGDCFHLTKMLSRIEKQNTDVPEDIYKIAVTFCELQHPEKALSYFSQYMSYRPYDERVLFLSGIAEANLGNYDHAVECMTRIMKMDPGDTVAQYYCGRIKRIKDGRDEAAVFDYSYAVPLEEARRRLEFINTCLDKEADEVRDIWQSDGDFSSLLVWGLECCEISLKLALAQIIADFKDEKSEKILRRYILRAEQPDSVKNHIFILLKKNGALEPYVANVGGGIVEVKVGYVADMDTDDGEDDDE